MCQSFYKEWKMCPDTLPDRSFDSDGFTEWLKEVT